MPLDPDALVRRLEDELGHAVTASHTHRGDATVSVRPDRWVAALTFCRDAPDLDMNYFRDLTVVDHIEEHPRFEVVVHLFSLSHKHAVRLKTRVPEDTPELATCTTVYPPANWFEREAWDMYGVVFTDHPDLRRLLLYDGFEGHALRKDYPVLKAHPLVAPLPTPPQRPAMLQDLVQISRTSPEGRNGS